ncbi:hypothetical protein HDU93_007704, partial [Gonapodya sp. JEL0774]
MDPVAIPSLRVGQFCLYNVTFFLVFPATDDVLIPFKSSNLCIGRSTGLKFAPRAGNKAKAIAAADSSRASPAPSVATDLQDAIDGGSGTAVDSTQPHRDLTQQTVNVPIDSADLNDHVPDTAAVPAFAGPPKIVRARRPETDDVDDATAPIVTTESAESSDVTGKQQELRPAHPSAIPEITATALESDPQNGDSLYKASTPTSSSPQKRKRPPGKLIALPSVGTFDNERVVSTDEGDAEADDDESEAPVTARKKRNAASEKGKQVVRDTDSNGGAGTSVQNASAKDATHTSTTPKPRRGRPAGKPIAIPGSNGGAGISAGASSADVNIVEDNEGQEQSETTTTTTAPANRPRGRPSKPLKGTAPRTPKPKSFKTAPNVPASSNDPPDPSATEAFEPCEEGDEARHDPLAKIAHLTFTDLIAKDPAKIKSTRQLELEKAARQKAKATREKKKREKEEQEGKKREVDMVE